MQNELLQYNQDSTSLIDKFFEPVKGLNDNDNDNSTSSTRTIESLDDEEEKTKLDELLNDKIVPFTLRQGELFSMFTINFELLLFYL